MKWHCPHFRTGVALTCFLALLAVHLDQMMNFFHIGSLSIALLMGMLAQKVLHIPDQQRIGIHFSAKNLLRMGTVLIGVRLDFHSFFHSGFTILLLASSVITGGLFFITWLGRRWRLSPMLSMLIAIDSSICGGSAVAAVGPTIEAKEEEIALIIPLCSLVGMAGMLGLKAVHHFLNFSPTIFGLLAGTTLHEVAQVMAAVLPVPAAIEVGMASKMMRVLLLAPVILILSFILSRKHNKENGTPKKISIRALIDAVWFVCGFLLVGAINSLVTHYFHHPLVATIDQSILLIATFLMTTAMAGVGLQVHFGYLIKNSLRAMGVAIFGWLFLVTLVVIEIAAMKV